MAQHNINVNAIAPGRILTEMSGFATPEAIEEIKIQTPLGRFGMPIDVARTVLFLVSESGDLIT